jgi:hypothetical protein
MEAERLVEGHGLNHVDGQQRYGADALDRLSLRLHRASLTGRHQAQGAAKTAHSLAAKGTCSSWRGVPNRRVRRARGAVLGAGSIRARV